MTESRKFDVIIIGGSYAGLAAGMAMGRALMNVLIIDSGNPCNKQTPYSHNFLTQDGKMPTEIAALGKQQVLMYKSVRFLQGCAVKGRKTDNGCFEIQVASGEIFHADKLIFATGIKDTMAGINGFAACWGISILHCPYCHGYEVSNEITGILCNGETAYELVRLISNWTTDLTLFTNETPTLTKQQMEKLESRNIKVVEQNIERFDHINGYLKDVIFKDGTKYSLGAIYTCVPFEQHCKIPESLGCELSNENYIRIDSFHETSVNGIFACGDNVGRMRTVANAVAMGTMVGMTVSKRLIIERF